MKIIVDMMGGDNAPLAVLEGAAQAVKEYGVQLIGVGNEALVRKTAAEHNIPLDGIELVNCTETIEMCDEPARAIRQKKDSSIVVGLNMLKEGKGDAFVSAGSTGALHVGASLIVRTLRGVKRPALATMVPAKRQAYLLLDCGANVECRPEMLAAFAVMGSCYVNKVEGRKNPSVALANNGAEESKGTPVLRDAHQLLKTTPGIRFVGNIEPRDVPNGEVDVVVCDGFTGNVILKLTEGMYQKYSLKRVFYSAYIPVAEDTRLPALDTKPPLLREHRLYQADWLLRFYQFKADEILDADHPNFNPYLDPKCNWAVQHYGLFPVDVNRASFEMLLRVPGIGPKSARRIWHARKQASLGLDELKRMGVVLKRAQYFITCRGFAGAHPGRGSAGRERITSALIDPNVFSGGVEQLSLFSPPAVDKLVAQGVPPHAAQKLVREEAVQCLARAL